MTHLKNESAIEDTSAMSLRGIIINARVTAPLLPTGSKEDYQKEAEEYCDKILSKGLGGTSAMGELIDKLNAHLEIAQNPYMLRGIKLAIKEATSLLTKELEDKKREAAVTRFEVIDHSPDGKGRAFVKYDIKDLEFSYQDNGKTLKIFINSLKQ